MAKLRLVAYRKETASSTSVNTYELDLQKEPNISVNYQFDDIKNPEKKKASFTQTFKLPFTDRNNEFFQNWYEVNLEKLVYNTRTRFEAALYYGTTPQFEGLLQLKSVYEKAGTYEVVLVSNIINLFNVVGENTIKDLFKNDDGTYSDMFNHAFNYTTATNNTLYNSWTGTLTNKDGTSLQDTDAGVSKVLYPLSFTMDGAYFSSANTYMNMSNPSANNNAAQYGTPMQQFRPALQLKAIFNLIFAKSGFSYTSAFIDGTGTYASEKYFSKLFMTTGSDLETAHPAVEDSSSNPNGYLLGGNDEEWGVIPIAADSSNCAGFDFPFAIFQANDFGIGNVYNQSGIYDTTYNTITRISLEMTSVTITTQAQFVNCTGCFNSEGAISVQLVRWDETNNVPDLDTVYHAFGVMVNFSNSSEVYINGNLDLFQMPVGGKAIIILKPVQVRLISAGTPASVTMGDFSPYLFNSTGDYAYSYISVSFTDNFTSIVGGNVDVPACIPDTITQKAFLKDIIQRFNLVVTTNPEDPSNLIIEPYDDYIGSGGTKFWTDKLDLSKEIIISDTTKLQKKTIKFSDLEDEDLMNKAIREDLPEINVFGKLEIEEVLNEFASGELKNDSIFAPFINQQIGETPTNLNNTDLKNMAVHFEIGYETDDEGVTTSKLSSTKPKLFYYCGTPTSVTTNLSPSSPDTTSYYFHVYTLLSQLPAAKEFTKYPVCTPYDIVPDGSSHQYTLTESNKSLYWGFAPPPAPNLTIFNYSQGAMNWTSKTLYFEYWKKYLDNLYSEDARVLECYLNLDATDIFDFSFSDEIFIRNSYWRIINIQNYQIGGQASTKVTLLKVLDSITYTGDFLYKNTIGVFVNFCPNDGTACGDGTLFADEQSCYAYGGTPYTFFDANAPLYPCFANTGSLPILLQSQKSAKSLFNGSNLKSIIARKFSGRNTTFVTGTDNTKFGQPIMPLLGDDLVIKNKSNNASKPQVQGEIHRLALSGYTEGTTKNYAYVQGDVNLPRMTIPNNSNMMIRINAIVTVVGGTNATYVLGTTESVAYYTAFKNLNGTITQLGTVRGTQEFSMTEGGIASSCTLIIDEDNGELTFGLQDSQANTFRAWSLSVELNVQRLPNIDNGGYNVSYALWQNAGFLYFQNNDNLIWN